MCVFESLLKLALFLSMVSVCLHTPQTIEVFPPLQYILLIADVCITLFFTGEALYNIYKTKKNYFHDRWSQFELFLLIFHYLSVIFDIFELVSITFPHLNLTYRPWYGVVRSPRPFIMIRLVRSVVRFQLPKNRIQQIIKRSSQQIQNVTIFFLFFMALYAIMGVQLFGRMEYHCVLPGTDPKNVTIDDLAIPDTMCSKEGRGGYECPPTMECMKLQLNSHQHGFYGMFNDFSSSLFTVYMAASQEGWVYVMYDCLDTFPSYIAFFYFVTLIFFLAWLVKNVFIAVITETFAEIRVQFSEMWQTREVQNEEHFIQRLEMTENGWRLVTIDSDVSHIKTPTFLYKTVRSTSFQIVMMVLVLLNALINASFVHYHDESDIKRKRIYYYIEILCFGSTLNVVPQLYGSNVFTYFQVFRILRLIKASPMLEDFLYKIFGPGKKLGGLVIFTMILLVTTSAISLQLFCYVNKLDKFRTFPQAFMSMFQIITQEGWTDVVVEILRSTNESMVPFVAIYFVGYHLFVTLMMNNPIEELREMDLQDVYTKMQLTDEEFDD